MSGCVQVRAGPMVLGAAFVLAVLAGDAGAQQVAFAAVPGELDSAVQTAISREIARARDRGIPTDPLVAKVREGRLKRASGARIQRAVVALAERLDSARAALGAASSTEELVAGADAIAAGASATELRTLRAATTRPIAVHIGTLAQLVASGIAPRRAVEMIVELVRRNATPSHVLALGNLVEVDVASGLRADESATIRLRGIEGAILGVTTGDAVGSASKPPAPPANTIPKRRP